jgi:hypothetical protein
MGACDAVAPWWPACFALFHYLWEHKVAQTPGQGRPPPGLSKGVEVRVASPSALHVVGIRLSRFRIFSDQLRSSASLT